MRHTLYASLLVLALAFNATAERPVEYKAGLLTDIHREERLQADDVQVFTVELDGTTYKGVCAVWCLPRFHPEEWKVGSPVDVYVEKSSVHVKRSNGKDLKLALVGQSKSTK